MENPKFLVIDLFCGAGGTTTGFEKSGTSKVIICVNHDANAIASHEANHPDCHHYIEDVRLVNIYAMLPIVKKYQLQYPDAKLVLWASAECTNFSCAKGGCPRDADSRSLANDLERYVEILQPDYFMCENVREFMSWGEMKDGKPISRKNGILYMRWVKSIQRQGYEYDWRLLNSADFGAYQSRERYFGIFAKDGLPIRFPTATHCKKPQIGTLEFLEDTRKPHKAVKEVLELDNIGNSIFRRKKPLVDRSLTRILKGLKKHANETMIMRNNNPGYCRSLNNPCGTITTKDTNYLITPSFLKGYFGNPENNPRIKSVNDSAPTVTTQSRYGLVSLKHTKKQFITRYFGNGGQYSSIEKPCGTITAMEVTGLVTADYKSQWINRYYTKGTQHTSIEEPCGTLTTVDKMALATARFIVNPQFNNVGSSINAPCPTVIALQGKKPLQLATAFYDITPDYLQPKDGDTEIMIELKLYCIEKGIADVYLRMLTEGELLRIQGFPKDYKLKGTASERKKYIGNAVEVNMAKALAEALAEGINHQSKYLKAA